MACQLTGGRRLQILSAGQGIGGGTMAAGSLFEHDRFLLKQKHLAIDQKYGIFDEQGNALIYVRRKAHHLRNLAALLAAVFVFFIVMFGLIAAAVAIDNDVVLVVLVVVGIVLGFAGAAAVATLLAPKRHVSFCRDQTLQDEIMTVYQDQKWQIPNATYTVADGDQNLIGWFRKNYLYDLFRRRWYGYGPDGALVCVAMEDSLIEALLRRFLGSFFGLLMRNFIICLPDRQTRLGEFNRKYTLLDRYVLDLTADAERVFDRRMAVALGVLLDTGERR
jgi:hypothetical protein